jgi:hypothetical protein
MPVIADAPGYTGCGFSQTADFTAQAIPPLNATYTGSIASARLGSGASLVLEVAQLAPVAPPRQPSAMPFYFDPLSATIAVSGSPCFTSGTTVGNTFPNQIAGDTINLQFTMNDGSQLLLFGYLNDLSEATLNAQLLSVFGGKCDQAQGSATLTVR